MHGTICPQYYSSVCEWEQSAEMDTTVTTVVPGSSEAEILSLFVSRFSEGTGVAVDEVACTDYLLRISGGFIFPTLPKGCEFLHRR